MAELARVALEGGGSILVESAASFDGPVKAGRVSDAVHDLPTSLQDALGPVAETARTALSQLRKANPAEIEVEFGVDLAVQAGAVITKSTAHGHLKVTMKWTNGNPGPPGEDESSG